MKESVKLFNALDGQKVSRETLEEIFRLAKVQKETALVFRIARILNENPEIDIFKIKLKKYPALNAPVEPTAIFDDGNLKPGYYFDNGHITTNTVEEFVALGIPELTEPIDEPEGLAKAVSPNEIYQYITDLILNTIKVSGHLPWQELWKESSFGSGMFATNFITKKHYRGINAFLLNYDVKNIDGEDVLVQKIWNNPYFMTFKQIQDKKGTLRKGSKGHFVVYFTKLYTHEETHADGTTLQFSSYDKKKFYNWIIANQHKLLILKQSGWTAERLSNVFIPILKYYKIFNGEDIAGVDFGEIPKNPNADKPEAEKIEICETVLGKIPNPPKIYYRGNQPAYFPKQDQIEMTPIEQFINPQSFYCVLFHELTHSTGHSKRLDRGNDTRKRDGSPEDKKAYDFEELVAEMGAVFLCAETGILFQTRDQSAKYLKYYLDKLTAQMKDDNRFFFRAASAAQAASDYILDRDAEGLPAYSKVTKTTVQDPAKKKTVSAKKATPVKPKVATPAVVKKTVPAKKPAKKTTAVKSKITVPTKVKEKMLEEFKTAGQAKAKTSVRDPKQKKNSNQLALFGTKPKQQRKVKKPSLKQPDIQQSNIAILPGELLPEVQPKETVLSGNKNTIAHKLRNRHNQPRNYYKIANDHIANFLGNIEIKNKESVAITLTGGQGSMKTRFCFQLMNALAQHYKVGHASIEEHPESGLYFDKVEQYLNDKAIHNISAPEISSIDDVHKLVRENDIIVIDSFSKLQEMDKNCELDKDFRKKYDGKLFIIIYQTTSDGKMRGGSKSQFDGDIVLFIEKCANYKENYVWPDKNRYQSTQLDQLKYNIFHQTLQKETSEGQTEPETVSTPEVDTTKFSFNVK